MKTSAEMEMLGKIETLLKRNKAHRESGHQTLLKRFRHALVRRFDVLHTSVLSSFTPRLADACLFVCC